MLARLAKGCCLLLVIWLLPACTALPRDSMATAPPQALQLLRDVVIPEGRTRLFIQHGHPVRGIDEFEPHCALEIRHLHGPPRTVPAGIYPIRRVQRVVTEVVYGLPSRRVAGVSVGIGVQIGGRLKEDTSPPDIFEGYHFWLTDKANVGLLRMSCFGARAMPYEAEPPSLAELDRVLGPLARLIRRK
jgi:hypothetical protein